MLTEITFQNITDMKNKKILIKCLALLLLFTTSILCVNMYFDKTINTDAEESTTAQADSAYAFTPVPVIVQRAVIVAVIVIFVIIFSIVIIKNNFGNLK